MHTTSPVAPATGADFITCLRAISRPAAPVTPAGWMGTHCPVKGRPMAEQKAARDRAKDSGGVPDGLDVPVPVTERIQHRSPAAQRDARVQGFNLRQLNGTGPALEIFRAIRGAQAHLGATVETAEGPKRGPAKRKARAPAITPEQITKARAGREAGLTWAVIAGHLQVSESGIKNAVSKKSADAF